MLKTTRGRVTWENTGRKTMFNPSTGEIALHGDRLIVSSGAQRREIPLEDVRAIGEAVPPFWWSPAGHRYAAVEFEEAGQRHRLAFMPGTGAFRTVGDSQLQAQEWLAAIQMAVKSATGNNLNAWAGIFRLPLGITPIAFLWLIPLVPVMASLVALLSSRHTVGGDSIMKTLPAFLPMLIPIVIFGGILASRAWSLGRNRQTFDEPLNSHTGGETALKEPPASRENHNQTNILFNKGIDFKSKATLFGWPLVHVATGHDPATGRKRVARGIVAIGDLAKGFIAFGGVAMGGLAFGGVALGIVSFGGLSIGLLALGGLAIGLLAAIGGGAVAPFALGGAALGYLAYGGEAFGAHVVSPMKQDPVAKQFFLDWAKIILDNLYWLSFLLVFVVIAIGVGIPLMMQWRAAKKSRSRNSDDGNPPAPNNPTQSRFSRAAGTAVNIVLAAAMAFVGWAAYKLGIFFNALFIFLLLSVPVLIAMSLWRTARGSLETRLWRRPFAPELRAQRWQVLNRWVFWLLAACVLKLCIVPAQFSPEQYSMIRLLIWGGVIAVLALALLPGKRVYLATNALFAIGSLFMAIHIASIHSASNQDAVVLSVPFRGEWLVVHGGTSPLVNHHYSLNSQRHALDLEKLENGLERTGDQELLDSFPSWEEPLFAPASGKVVKAVGHLPDNPIGQTDDRNVAGNHLIIDIGKERYVLMAHLKQGSLRVKEGDIVQPGQLVAQCGNSGNTSHPHLHLQVQTKPEFYKAGNATYPIVFSDGNHVRSDRTLAPTTALPRRNDRIIGSQTNMARAEVPSIDEVSAPVDDPPQTEQSKESAAATAARSWLSGIDKGAYAQSWDDGAAVFQKAVSKSVWVSQLESVRKPLGKLILRNLISAQHTTTLPGASGEHVVMQFKTSFAEMPIAVETVTFTLEKDRNWKASGYFIK